MDLGSKRCIESTASNFENMTFENYLFKDEEEIVLNNMM